MQRNGTQICAEEIYKTEFFVKLNGSQDILTFVDFTVLKFAFRIKIIYKTLTTKNQENSAHRFGDNYLTNHLMDFLQGRSWSS